MPGVLEASHHLGWAEVMCAARTRSGINGKPRVTRCSAPFDPHLHQPC